MKNKILMICAAFFVLISLITCENQIINKWWVPDEKEPSEPEYISIIKTIPVTNEQQTEIIIEHEIVTEHVYETIIKEVEKIVEKIVEVQGQERVEFVEKIVTVVEQLTHEEIITLFRELDPEEVLEILTDDQYKYIFDELKTTQIVEIEKVITETLSYEKFIEFLKKQPPEKVYEILTEEQIDYIKENLVFNIGNETINLGDAYTLIRKIPRRYIYDFLTPDQRETVVMQMKPEILLKYLEIERIEYIIFEENTVNFSIPVNVNEPEGLTAKEVAYNMSIITDMAKYIKQLYSISNPRVLLIHGHANPDEKNGVVNDLKTLSQERAEAVYAEIVRINGGKGTGTQWPLGEGVNVISLRWFGGDKSLYESGGPYEKLNRRVEVMFYKSLGWIDWKGGGTPPEITP